MPELERPDGALIHWKQRGEGPLVVLTMQFFGSPKVYEDLIADLARDHRVVVYDPRGSGESSRDAEFNPVLDTGDLVALIEQVGGPAVLISVGDGTNRAVRAAVTRPDLVTALVTPGGNPVALEAARGTEALAASQSVLEALAGMIETDYRGALRTIIASANAQLSEEQIKQRVQETVEYCSQEVAIPRMHAWINDDLAAEGRQLGDRLWMLATGDNPWFPIEVAERAKQLLPEAHIEIVADGPLSRPDITAAVVRILTGTGQMLASESSN